MSKLAVQPKKVDYKLFKIEEETAVAIENSFKPAIDKMLELAPSVLACLEMEESPEQEKEAKELHSKFVRIRTATNKIHAHEKGKVSGLPKYCDALKNARKEIGDPIEAKLKEIKDRAKLKKEAEIAELNTLRSNQIAQFLAPDAAPVPNLGEMDEILWATLLDGTKATYELNKKKLEDAEAEAKKKADYQAETMRRYNELMPYQRFATEETKKTYANMSPNDFEAVLTEAKMLSKKADEEVENLRKENEAINKKLEEAEKTVPVEETIYSGANDKETLVNLCDYLDSVKDKFTFQDPEYVKVFVKTVNYLTQLTNNLESFNNQKQ